MSGCRPNNAILKFRRRGRCPWRLVRGLQQADEPLVAEVPESHEGGRFGFRTTSPNYVNIVDMTLVAVLLLCGLIYELALPFMVVEELGTLVCIYLAFFLNMPESESEAWHSNAEQSALQMFTAHPTACPEGHTLLGFRFHLSLFQILECPLGRPYLRGLSSTLLSSHISYLFSPPAPPPA